MISAFRTKKLILATSAVTFTAICTFDWRPFKTFFWRFSKYFFLFLSGSIYIKEITLNLIRFDFHILSCFSSKSHPSQFDFHIFPWFRIFLPSDSALVFVAHLAQFATKVSVGLKQDPFWCSAMPALEVSESGATISYFVIFYYIILILYQ